MPKLRTRKTVSKRFKISASGKLMRRCTKMNHLMRKKTASQQRHLQKCQPLDASDAPRLRRMLGEGF